MVRISPKTAKASGTKGESVSNRSHSVSLPYVQRVSENGLSNFSKNKELAHSTSLILISSVSISSTTKIRHQGNLKKMWSCVGKSVRRLWWILYWRQLRPFGVSFKEHVVITTASTTTVGDHPKLSGPSWICPPLRSSRGWRVCSREALGRPSKYFSGSNIEQRRSLRVPRNLSKGFVTWFTV